MSKNGSNILEFAIFGLFDEKNIIIPFLDNVMIIIGENGQSKSTFLKIFNFVLRGELDKLEPIIFKSIRIKFKKQTVIITYEELRFNKNHEKNDSRIGEIRKLCEVLDKEELLKKTINSEDKVLYSKMKSIRENVSSELLHFPTYRRVEEDLYKLITYHHDSKDFKKEDVFKQNFGETIFNEIIQFGMTDVKKVLNQISGDKSISLQYKGYLLDFIETCNGYLIKKYFEYDDSLGAINLYNEQEQTVDLSNLSSGEKQIVSIFSKIYLSNHEKFVILFDEPELSLSIEWQEKLLVDILNTGKCDLMFVVTHSPFVFNNSLKVYAKSIDSFNKELSE
ncbi:AAA family ATPase [Paenibacillus sp. sgz500992]|uniref:AAA family ATPase n=1 Tax=Paenibacillus sp. sgz500992 TaxID=3242476 RepID=UPI0036D42FD3